MAFFSLLPALDARGKHPAVLGERLRIVLALSGDTGRRVDLRGWPTNLSPRVARDVAFLAVRR